VSACSEYCAFGAVKFLEQQIGILLEKRLEFVKSLMLMNIEKLEKTTH